MGNDFDPNKNRLYRMTEYISWGLITTLYILSNYIILFFLFLFLEISILNFVWYLIGIIPLGPAVSAVIGSAIHTIEENDYSTPGQNFRKYYRQNFLDSFKIWIPYLAIIYLFIININYYFNIIGNQFSFIGYIFILFSILVTLYLIPLFLIQTKFHFRYKDLLKLGLYYFFMKLKLTIGNLLILLGLVALLVFVSELLFIILLVPFFYLLTLYNYSVIKDVKTNFVKA